MLNHQRLQYVTLFLGYMNALNLQRYTYLIRENKTQSSRVELRCEVDNQVLIVIDDALRTEVDEQALMADSLVKWTCFGTSG